MTYTVQTERADTGGLLPRVITPDKQVQLASLPMAAQQAWTTFVAAVEAYTPLHLIIVDGGAVAMAVPYDGTALLGETPEPLTLVMIQHRRVTSVSGVFGLLATDVECVATPQPLLLKAQLDSAGIDTTLIAGLPADPVISWPVYIVAERLDEVALLNAGAGNVVDVLLNYIAETNWQSIGQPPRAEFIGAFGEYLESQGWINQWNA